MRVKGSKSLITESRKARKLVSKREAKKKRLIALAKLAKTKASSLLDKFRKNSEPLRELLIAIADLNTEFGTGQISSIDSRLDDITEELSNQLDSLNDDLDSNIDEAKEIKRLEIG